MNDQEKILRLLSACMDVREFFDWVGEIQFSDGRAAELFLQVMESIDRAIATVETPQLSPLWDSGNTGYQLVKRKDGTP